MSEEGITVTFGAVIYNTRFPRRYKVQLFVDQIPTGIGAYVWGKRRARQVMSELINNGAELLADNGLTGSILSQVRAQRREEAMAKVKVGDSVRLLVDIGPIKKGRVCRIVEVEEPSFYESRGGNAWDEDRYPIKVVPVAMSSDNVTLGPKDSLPLQRGEFGPLDEDVDE